MFETLDAADILISDLHFLLGPLVAAPGPSLRPECAFLIDPARYAEEYGKEAVGGFEHFRVTPMPRLKRNRFWGYYRRIVFAEPAGWGAWHLQLPFVAEPLDLEIVLDAGQPLGNLPVTAKILLRPSGWSSFLELAPDGRSADALTGLVGRLRASDSKPFVCDGKARTAREIFQLLGDRLKDDLFGKGKGKDAWDLRQFGHHYVVSVAGSAGEARPYHPKPKKLGDTPPLETSEKAQAYSFLWGSPLSEDDVASEEAQGFMLTDLWGADFAVSRFGVERMGDGTLISLTDSLSRGRSRESIRCLAMNLRSCWSQVFALHRLLYKTKSIQGRPPRLQELRLAAEQILPWLSETYTNSFCQDLFRKHNDLKRYAAMASAVESGGEEEGQEEDS